MKKVSINRFETALNKDNDVTIVLHNTDVEVMVKKNLSLMEMLSFVNFVVDSCVDVDEYEYSPEAYDFSIRVALINHYTNLTLPSNMEKQYRLVYETCVFSQVMEVIDRRQFNDIISTIDKKIEFNTNLMTSAAAGKMIEVIDKLNEIVEENVSSMSEVSPETIKKISMLMNSTNFSERVAESYVNSEGVSEVDG